MTDTEIIRLRQEVDRLRAENASLRPLVSELTHRLSVVSKMAKRCASCEFYPTSTGPTTDRLQNHG